jgi:hypothetical protein
LKRVVYYIIFLLLLTGCVTTREVPELGKPVADFPEMMVGEKYTLDMPVGSSGIHRHVWTVKKVYLDKSFDVEQTCDKEGTRVINIDKNISVYGGKNWALKFPLFVGKQWELSFDGQSVKDGTSQYYTNVFNVVKFDSVATNYGNLPAFKILIHHTYVGSNWTGLGEFWYSPEVKMIVKMDVSWMASGKLVKYEKVGNPVASINDSSKKLDVDQSPPEITITHPQQRGVKITAKEASITVIGKATDGSGVATVTVNGNTAALDANGNFSAEVLLKVGENRIVVAATNIHKKSATETFILVREAGQIAAKVKQEIFQKAEGIGGGKYYSLIIGNNDYRYLSRLQTAVNDATMIEKILKELYGFESRLLLNATRKDILSAINELRNRLSERDNLLIYYAGHGEFDRSADKAYWLPVDALRDDPTDWIIADDITSSIRRLSSRHVLIVSDSCYSGTLTRSTQTSLVNKGERDEFLKKMTSRPSRTLMASGGNEPVADGGGSGHSIFADSFLKALSEIENSVFTADELFYQNIRSRVAGRSDQVPEYSEIRNSGHDGGDFIFIRSK